ncbi:MAG: hypothetical protein R3Y43_07425 [Alphaproteobacteria bacterium]
MKNFIHQLFILLGIYFTISYIFSFINLSIIIDLFFIISLVVFCYKKKFIWISRVESKYTKTTIYLKALGYVEFLSVFIITPIGVVHGYNAASAKYNNIEYSSNLYTISTIIYFIILVISLIYATYLAFFNKKSQ